MASEDNPRMRILIVGGYGFFGGRLVRLLEDDPRFALIVAGRSLAKAQAFCAARKVNKATLIPAAFDRDGDVGAQLAAHAPDLLADCSGPFQAYGERPYRVVEACIAQRVHYLDLADGAAFVEGVAAFDVAARAAGVFALSGASTFPALTAAVVRRLSSGMARVDSIRAGIAPSPFAGLGENVIRAIASYAGRRTTLDRDGKARAAYPLTEHVRVVVAPAGCVPLRSRLFSLIDAPDLRTLPALWPEAKRIWTGAGSAPALAHRSAVALAWLVRLRLLRSLAPFGRTMHRATTLLRWGEHRGGMFVAIEGVDAKGRAAKRSWHMIAEGDDGPLIPAMAVAAIVRRTLDGCAPPAGARACVRDVELKEYETQFAPRAIRAGVRDDDLADSAPLYVRILGDAWESLPPEIRAMHAGAPSATARGRATVERGRSLLSRLVAAVIGFPAATADTPVGVRFDSANGVETWTRTFGTQSFRSRQLAGRGRSERLLCERFGPLTFAMALVVDDGRLSLALRRWSAFGVPLPLWLGARSDSYETVEDGRFRFHVDISHPLTGLIVRYRGWLVPDESSTS